MTIAPSMVLPPPEATRATDRAQTAIQPRVADVSVVIVTWNSLPWIERCLAALPAACDGLSWELIVQDNASTDGTLSALESVKAERIVLIADQRNRGFAGGVNHAITRARGRHVLTLNPDCELSPKALTRLVRYLDSHPEVGAVVPLLHGEDQKSQREFQLRRFPTLGSLAVEILLLDKFFPNNRVTSRYRYRDLDLSVARAVDQPAAAAMLIRHEIVDAAGPFDEQFAPAWFEDVDYCQRIWKSGKAIHVLPGATAIHHGGVSLAHVGFDQFVNVWYRNLFLYARKWLPARDAEVIRWCMIIGMMMRIIAVAIGVSKVSVPPRAAIATYREVMKKAFHRWDDQSPS